MLNILIYRKFKSIKSLQTIAGSAAISKDSVERIEKCSDE